MTNYTLLFFRKLPTLDNFENLKALEHLPDRFFILGREVFLYIPVSYGTTKLSNQYFENKLKVKATTRNWKTVNKLFEMATALSEKTS